MSFLSETKLKENWNYCWN